MRLGNLIRGEMGYNPYSPMRKEWVALAGALIGAGVSAIGGAQASQANAAARRAAEAQKARDDADYTRRKYEDYASTATGQGLIRKAEQFNRRNWRKARGGQAVAGGTDSATQMTKDAGNEMMAETLGNVAAIGQQRRERAEELKRRSDREYTQQVMAYEQNRAQNISNAAGAASNAIMQGASAFENGTSLQGGSNQGTPVAKSTAQIDAEVGAKAVTPSTPTASNAITEGNTIKYDNGKTQGYAPNAKEWESFRNAESQGG